ncbi:hypothetical protein WR25_09317 isoform H [Diploscapter pachys]|uniref:Battenin n=1 Tax=Diploscapter pachys TaxID=2018661 RepID=A0A2A2L5B1_9BILA|nr:hypothetical protein WR25_09317 isoform A [Diploscapter pachys]PAV81318.1 hypothetical protein WR25_09317 isoform C [Diploscapter pachys]PAV81320.1 hypothetical protein WR25_09317 isoform E [Diploscapter pachys]PAV81323.1 hypothetical protein WR25_09317 isoform H [Diploscapter pachys]
MFFFKLIIIFSARVFTIICLQAIAYFVVAFSSTIAMSLAGVVITSLGCGLGEITFLALTAHFHKSAIGGWSSGTGGAGLIGSFSYAFLTEPKMGDLSPKVALLIQLFIPVLFFAAYFIVLVIPDTVYRPSLPPTTWLVPKNYDEFIQKDRKEGDPILSKVPQREITFKEKIFLIKPLLHLMIPLSTVYVGEYLINQGTTQLIFFKCSKSFGLSKNSQYRWYQVLYQFGVFISRSSIKFIELPTLVLYMLPVLQLLNMTFFILEARYWFVPHIAIIFAMIVFEGLFGGSSYVNTFHKIHKMVAPDVREYSLSAASLGDTLGVNIAAFLAIILHNGICNSWKRYDDYIYS